MQNVAYIILSVLILLLMILIHEAGHYTMAKILGFTVDEFSVGFGPKLFSHRKKNGELFSLRLLPLGGFCAFYGETDEEEKTEPADAADKTNSVEDSIAEVNSVSDNANENESDAPEKEVDKPEKDEQEDLLSYVMRSKLDEDREKEKAAEAAKPQEEQKIPRFDKDGNPAKTFNMQKPWKRIIVLLGGVLFNFISAFIFSLIYIWAVGTPVPMVAEVYSDSMGELYCPDIRVNDCIVSVNGEDVTIMTSFDELMQDVSAGETVNLRVLRDGKEVTVSARKKQITITENGKETTYDGLGFVSFTQYVNAGEAGAAFKYCVPYTFKLSWSIIGSFGGLFTGKTAITDMTGPVGSVSLMAELSAADWRNILILLPLLASNLAIFNILPFPALDGAHIVFTVIEWIRKKPIKRNVEAMIHFVGLMVLLLFVIVVDILSFAL